MGRPKIGDDIKRQIVDMYESKSDITYKEIADRFGVSKYTVGNAIRIHNCKSSMGITEAELDRKHADFIAEKRKEHEEMTTWMEHVTPLHQHKQRLEAEIEEKQQELDKVKQEYRNFLATLRQLGEDMT